MISQYILLVKRKLRKSVYGQRQSMEIRMGRHSVLLAYIRRHSCRADVSRTNKPTMLVAELAKVEKVSTDHNKISKFESLPECEKTAPC